MPRIRTIKPEFWTDAKVVALSPLARLLFIGAWNFADDFGCLAPEALQLKLRVLPTAPEDADEMVAELFEAGLFEELRTPSGERFWHVTNWNRHQRVSKPSPSDYGTPDTWTHAPTRAFPESPGIPPDDTGALRTEGNGKEGKGRERNGMELRREATPESSVVLLPTAKATLDALKDTLVEVCGEPPPSGWSLYNRIATWIRDRGGTPDEIRRRSGLIVEEWGRKALTPASLEKHWTRYDAEVGQLTDAGVEEYQEEVRRQQRRREAMERDAQRRGLPG